MILLILKSNEKRCGFSETDRVKKAQQMGAGAYVRKPYAIETIGMAVKAELEKSKRAA